MTTVWGVRRAGMLLHPTSLPGHGVCGQLGPEALRFIDFLVSAGFSVWQTLPFGPVDRYGSPYRLRSIHAGEPGLIDGSALPALEPLPEGLAHDSQDAASLADACRRFAARATAAQRRQFATFVRRHRRWLLPYALFEVQRERFDRLPWWQWPPEIRERQAGALRRSLVADAERLRSILFQQYWFELQWQAVKQYANRRGVYLFGDLPLYVDHDSAEAWWQRRLFRLDRQGQPLAVAGVPPDYFSADGQLWGNPLYDWERMREEGFRWWVERVRLARQRFDMLRIDHFRALESYWEVPAGAATARDGRWRSGPGSELLATLFEQVREPNLVAEDLGEITPAVRALRDRFELPGMAVIQFAFDGSPDNPHLPRNHAERSVAYTGTHDNDTLAGWYASLDEPVRRRIAAALELDPATLPAALLDAVYASRARLAVVPMQDLLGLGSAARMNTPGTTKRGNWRWRFRWPDLDASLASESRRRIERHERLP